MLDTIKSTNAEWIQVLRTAPIGSVIHGRVLLANKEVSINATTPNLGGDEVFGVAQFTLQKVTSLYITIQCLDARGVTYSYELNCLSGQLCLSGSPARVGTLIIDSVEGISPKSTDTQLQVQQLIGEISSIDEVTSSIEGKITSEDILALDTGDMIILQLSTDTINLYFTVKSGQIQGENYSYIELEGRNPRNGYEYAIILPDPSVDPERLLIGTKKGTASYQIMVRDARYKPSRDNPIEYFSIISLQKKSI